MILEIQLCLKHFYVLLWTVNAYICKSSAALSIWELFWSNWLKDNGGLVPWNKYDLKPFPLLLTLFTSSIFLFLYDVYQGLRKVCTDLASKNRGTCCLMLFTGANSCFSKWVYSLIVKRRLSSNKSMPQKLKMQEGTLTQNKKKCHNSCHKIYVRKTTFSLTKNKMC